jgi:hypothetical protein
MHCGDALSAGPLRIDGHTMKQKMLAMAAVVGSRDAAAGSDVQ